jgi:hypothetical protein
MIKLNITNQEEETLEFSLKNKWEEISITDYCKITEILKNEDNKLKKIINIINILSDVPLDGVLMTLDIEELNELYEVLEFLNEEPKTDDKQFEFEYENKQYAIKKDYTKLTTEEAINLEVLLSKNKTKNVYELAFALLFREKDENGELKPFDLDKAQFYLDNFMDKIKIVEVYAHINFFLTKEKKYKKTSQEYLNHQNKKKKIQIITT